MDYLCILVIILPQPTVAKDILLQRQQFTIFEMIDTKNSSNAYVVIYKVIRWIICFWKVQWQDNDCTGFWPPGSLHTLGADGHI